MKKPMYVLLGVIAVCLLGVLVAGVVAMLKADPEPGTGGPATGEAAYVTALAALDPHLGEKADRTISRGKDTCLDIASGEHDEAALAARARERYSDDTFTVTEPQAATIVAAARQYLCG